MAKRLQQPTQHKMRFTDLFVICITYILYTKLKRVMKSTDRGQKSLLEPWGLRTWDTPAGCHCLCRHSWSCEAPWGVVVHSLHSSQLLVVALVHWTDLATDSPSLHSTCTAAGLSTQIHVFTSSSDNDWDL